MVSIYDGYFETVMAVESLELEKNECRDTVKKQDVLPINDQADMQPEMLRWGKNERMTSYGTICVCLVCIISCLPCLQLVGLPEKLRPFAKQLFLPICASPVYRPTIDKMPRKLRAAAQAAAKSISELIPTTLACTCRKQPSLPLCIGFHAPLKTRLRLTSFRKYTFSSRWL